MRVTAILGALLIALGVLLLAAPLLEEKAEKLHPLLFTALYRRGSLVVGTSPALIVVLLLLYLAKASR